MGVNSLPKTVTRQRHGCDLNPGPSAPESSTLTTRLRSHPELTTELPANKPETTAVAIIARWPQVSHTAFSYSTYSRRHVIGQDGYTHTPV